jgi:tetratricopeptide (TPR) repeat protein
MGAVRSGKARKAPKPPVQPRGNAAWPRFLVVFGAALVLAVWAYAPALKGPFLFDDMALPYAVPARATLPLAAWISSVRPLLYFTFWLNYSAYGSDTFSYHLINLIIHALNATLIFFIVRRLLVLSNVSKPLLEILAGFAAALFLLHPMQTESVAYIASRSEILSALFLLAALALFVSRMPGRLTWGASLSILLLFLAGCASKEQGVALVPVLLLADYLWNSGPSLSGIRGNWKLYLPLAASLVIPAVMAWKILSVSLSAGFKLPDFTWYQYFFTQCRAFFAYIGLFLLPVRQTVDHDFPPSKTVFEHGSLLGLIAILVIAGLAIAFRKRYRLASYGVLLFVVLLAPSSSFLPLRDTFAEHRIYLPMFGLILVLMEFLSRMRIAYKPLIAAGGIVIIACGVLTYSRSQLWGDPVLLWQDAVAKAPNHARPYDSLAVVYITNRRCREAANLLDRISKRINPMPYYMLAIWSEAEDCLSHPAKAGDLIAKAAAIHPDPQFYVRLGIMRAKQGETQASLDAFNRAIALNPLADSPYVYRGRWYEAVGRPDLAAQDYRRALELNSGNVLARELLDQLERRSSLSGTALR